MVVTIGMFVIFYRIKARWALVTWPGREAYIKSEALRYEKLKRLRGKNSLKQLVTDPSMIHASYSAGGTNTGIVSDRIKGRSMNLIDTPRRIKSQAHIDVDMDIYTVETMKTGIESNSVCLRQASAIISRTGAKPRHSTLSREHVDPSDTVARHPSRERERHVEPPRGKSKPQKVSQTQPQSHIPVESRDHEEIRELYVPMEIPREKPRTVSRTPLQPIHKAVPKRVERPVSVPVPISVSSINTDDDRRSVSNPNRKSNTPPVSVGVDFDVDSEPDSDPELMGEDRGYNVSWRDDKNMRLVDVQSPPTNNTNNTAQFLSASDVAYDMEEDEWDEMEMKIEVEAFESSVPAPKPPPQPFSPARKIKKMKQKSSVFFPGESGISEASGVENDPPSGNIACHAIDSLTKSHKPAMKPRLPVNKQPLLTVDTDIDSNGSNSSDSEPEESGPNTGEVSRLCDSFEAMVGFDMESDEYDSDDGVVDKKAVRKQRLVEFLQNKKQNALARAPVLSGKSPTLLHPNAPRYRAKQTSNDYRAASMMNPFDSFLKSKNGDGSRTMRDRAAALGYLGDDIDGYLNSEAYRHLLSFLKQVMHEWLKAAIYERRLRLSARGLSVQHDRTVQMDYLLRWMSVTSRTSHRSLIWTTFRKRRHSMLKSINASSAYVPPKNYHHQHNRVGATMGQQAGVKTG